MTFTPTNDEATVHSGYTLTILRKNADGAWVLARDANLLTPQTKNNIQRRAAKTSTKLAIPFSTSEVSLQWTFPGARRAIRGKINTPDRIQSIELEHCRDAARKVCEAQSAVECTIFRRVTLTPGIKQ